MYYEPRTVKTCNAFIEGKQVGVCVSGGESDNSGGGDGGDSGGGGDEETE